MPSKDFAHDIYAIDRTQWGRWKLDGGDLVYWNPEYPALEYAVPVKKLASDPDLLNWIRQLEEKTWCTEQDLGHFVRAAFALMTHQKALGSVPVPPEVMSPWHAKAGEFHHLLNERVSVVTGYDELAAGENCSHTPDCPQAVALLKTLGLDEAAVARSLEYFRRAGGTCDCRIAIEAMTSELVP